MYSFELKKAESVASAAALLAQTNGKALAGGQSLVAAMKLRLAQPAPSWTSRASASSRASAAKATAS